MVSLPSPLRTLPPHLPGKRQTRQRLTIYRVITEANGPLTIPEIHERAQVVLPRLGIATVYRTLKLLQEEERVRDVVFPNGETRYELTGLGHHHHFRCRSCDQVFDLRTCPVEIPHDRCIEGGFLVDGHELTLYGRCPGCS